MKYKTVKSNYNKNIKYTQYSKPYLSSYVGLKHAAVGKKIYIFSWVIEKVMVGVQWQNKTWEKHNNFSYVCVAIEISELI